MTIRDNWTDLPYEELTEAERGARLREEISRTTPQMRLAVWRVLGLPEGHVVEEPVDDVIGEAGEHGHQP